MGEHLLCLWNFLFNWEFSLGEGVRVVTEIVFISNFLEIIKTLLSAVLDSCPVILRFLELAKSSFCIKKFGFTAFMIKVSERRAYAVGPEITG